MKTTTDQVRQILMNELGLTRESVRQEMEKIVVDAVARYMHQLENNGALNAIVETAFERKYKNPQYGYADFRSLVVDAAKNAASKYVLENLSIGKK